MTRLRIVRFARLSRWLPGHDGAIETDAPLVPLGDVLARRLEPVEPEAFGDHAPITIRFGGAIDPRDRDEPYKGKMYAVRAGDLVFSKIDLRNGAIGLLPAALAPAVVTSEYPVYVPDPEAVNAAYLALVLRTAPFEAQIRALVSGTSGRKRIRPEQFEALEVPLPTPAEQDALVAAHAAARAEADALDQAAARVEADAVRAFEAALGLTPPPDLPKVKLRIARFKDFDRWSHEGVIQQESEHGEADVPLTALGDVVEDLNNGWSPQCLTRPAGEGEWGVLKVGAVSSGVYRADENKALPRRLKPRPELEVQPGDVLIGRANVMRLVGAAARVGATPAKLLLCDKIYRVNFGADALVDPDFLVESLKTPGVRVQIEAAATGTSPTMKNISKESLLGLMLPLPASLRTQRQLAADLRARRGQAADLRQRAAQARGAADVAFADAVFTS